MKNQNDTMGKTEGTRTFFRKNNHNEEGGEEVVFTLHHLINDAKKDDDGDHDDCSLLLHVQEAFQDDDDDDDGEEGDGDDGKKDLQGPCRQSTVIAKWFVSTMIMTLVIWLFIVWKTMASNTMTKLTTNAATKPSTTVYFTVGLEGTGHHFIQKLVRQSPSFRLQNSLPNLDEHMISAVHAAKDYVASCYDTSSQDNDNKTAKTIMVVDHLQQVAKTIDFNFHHNHAIRNATSPKLTNYIPFNTRELNEHQLSYPDGRHCDRKAHPDLDWFYQYVAQPAGFQPATLYIYRDPYQVLRSTTIHRDMNRDGMDNAIQLYTDMLTAIEQQFVRLGSSNRILACIGLYDGNQPPQERWDRLGKILGYDQESFSPQAFRDVVAKMQRPETPITPDEQQEMIPENARPAMKQFLLQHERVIELCQKQLVPFSSL